MVRISKKKQELQAAQQAHKATRQDYAEALHVAQYLSTKVESLRNVIADLTAGAELQIVLDGYSYELEDMERIVLDRASHKLIDDTPNEPQPNDLPALEPKPRQKRRKLNHTTSSDAADLLGHFTTSDGLTINPADIFSSDPVFSSDVTAFSEPEPEPEVIDPELLAEQLEHARAVLGELAETPVAQRILYRAPLLTREQLERMRGVLEVDEEAREDVVVFADALFGQ